MKVSIITVCHNQLAHTKRFIASLKRFTPQEPIEWDLLIVDSGSTDGTFEYLSHYCGEPKFGRVTFKENIGWIKGINEGLKFIEEWNKGVGQTPPDIIVFANNDVVLDAPGWLERLCKHFDNPTVGAVGPTSNYVIGRQRVEFNVPHVTEEPANTVVGFFMAVRRELVDVLGPLEENFADYVPEYPEESRRRLSLGGADDLDYCWRIREQGFKIVIARDVFVWHSGSQTFIDVVGKDGYEQQWRLADLAFERKWGAGSREKCFEVPLKIMFAVPMRSNHPNWKFAKSLVYLTKPPSWHLVESRRCMVDQARNQFVQMAQTLGPPNGPFDYILFLDDDHTFPHDLLYKLLSHNKDVVGALCFRRIEPFGPCLFSWCTDAKNGNLMVRDRPDLIGKGLQRVDAVGFGAVLVKMEVFQKLGPPPWFKFSEVGEDLHFCDLCAQAGIEIFCDTDLVAPHINDDGHEVDASVFYEYHKVAR